MQFVELRIQKGPPSSPAMGAYFLLSSLRGVRQVEKAKRDRRERGEGETVGGAFLAVGGPPLSSLGTHIEGTRGKERGSLLEKAPPRFMRGGLEGQGPSLAVPEMVSGGGVSQDFFFSSSSGP